MLSEIKRLLVVADDLPDEIVAALQQALPQAEIVCLSFEAEFSNQFEAAIVLTTPGQSPYPAAYRCYLAGIPIRIGQSIEFGGGVLSHCIEPISIEPIGIEPIETDDLIAHHLHLLRSIGLVENFLTLA